MNRIIAVVILVIINITASSCFLHKRVTGGGTKNTDTITTDTSRLHTATLPQQDTVAIVKAPDTPTIAKQLIEQLTPLWKARIDYKTFSGKAKIHFSGPDNDKEFTAHFRIRKDSVIWINITYDAIPVARIFVTRDSFFLLNTLEKEVTRTPLNQAAKILPTKVDFTSLQNLMTGEPLRDGTITNAASVGDTWVMQVEDSSYIQHITVRKTDSTIRISQLRTRVPKGPQASTSYDNYEVIDGKRIATSRTLNIQKGADVYLLDMNVIKAGFDEPLDFPFSIPKSYSVKK